MMRPLRLAAAAAAVVVLVGCAQPAAERPAAEQTEAPTVEPTRSASATPTATAAPVDPHAGWQRIETPNGSASFLIPPGWTAELEGEVIDWDGTAWWSNGIRVIDPTGVARLGYWDGPGDDVGAVVGHEVLAEERLDTLDASELEGIDLDDRDTFEHWARAWWEGGDGGDVYAHVRVSPRQGPGEQPVRSISDGRRLITFGTASTFSTREQAVAWLEGDEAAQVFEIVRTLDLHGAPADALPEQ